MANNYQSQTPKQKPALTWAQKVARNTNRARYTTLTVIGVMIFFASFSVHNFWLTLGALALVALFGWFAYDAWK